MAKAELTGIPGAIDRGDVQYILNVIQAANGSPFVKPPLRYEIRELMGALMAAYGVPEERVHNLATDQQLCALYATAKGSIAEGRDYACKLRLIAKANELVKTRITDEYFANPAAPPVRLQPAAPPAAADMAKYALNTRVDGLARDMGARHAELQTNLTDTLLKFTEALPEVVKSHVGDALKALTPVTLHVVIPGKEPTMLGVVHRETGKILKMLMAGVNVYLHGPAGSGKTTVGRKCAEAFGLPFYFAAKVESEYMLLGFKDARGETVRTQFREAYEHGGVFLFDELDGSSPSAVVALNAALANGICPFPDGIVMRHADFKCIAAGNTKLSGASRQYVGRNQLDAASVDRFAFVEFGYDDTLETALATNSIWCEYVQAARKAVIDRALPHLITPRATYDGCKLLEAGLTALEVASAVLWKGLDESTISQLIAAMPDDKRKLIGKLNATLEIL